MTDKLYKNRYIFLITSRAVLFRIRNVPDKLCTEIKKKIVFSNFYFRKSYGVRDNVREYCEAGQATDDKMAHAQQCMLDTYGYKHTLRICNNYCF